MKKSLLLAIFTISLLVADQIPQWPYISDQPLKSTEDLLRSKAAFAGMKANPKTLTFSKKAALGQMLFNEKMLSRDKTVSCALCHDIADGGDDGISTAIGIEGQANPQHLNTPTVLNTGYAKYFFWNGRADTLREQAKGPMQASFEMAATPETIEARFKNHPEYKNLFAGLYQNGVTFDNVADAISIYETTLLTRGRFDRFMDGDDTALSDIEQKGLTLFIDKGCVSCHSGVSVGGEQMMKFPLRYHSAWASLGINRSKQLIDAYKQFGKTRFTNEQNRYDYLLIRMGEENATNLKESFFNTLNDKEKEEALAQGCTYCHQDNQALNKKPYPFENCGGFLGKDDKKYFRVPILREITKTAPYFHNGSVNKLEDAISIMGTHQLGITLTKKEVNNIAAFLKTLEGHPVDRKF